jgi:3-oxoacyl-[acyl-carrier-protein] synthase II
VTAVSIAGASAISPYGLGWRGLGGALAGGAAMPGVPGVLTGGAGFERARKMMSRGAELAAACLHALVGELGWRGDGVGYYLGVGASGGSLGDLTAMLVESIGADGFSLARFGDRGLAACNPLLAFQLMNNFTLCHGAILDGTSGPNAAVFSRGAGTTAALVEAIHAVRSGDITRAIAGGADSAIHPVTAAELARDGFIARGLAPVEGAALVALETGDGGFAVIDHCAVASGRGRALADALDEAAMVDEAIEHVVVTAWGPPALDEVRAWVRARMPRATVVDASSLGGALAASPALGWLAALDLVGSRAMAIDAGIDGDVGVVAISRRASLPRRRAPERRQAVITGVGVVSAFGIGAKAFFGALAEGRSAVGPIHSFDASTFPTRVAGEVPAEGLDLRSFADRLPAFERDGAFRDRKLAFGLLAAAEAWARAGCGPGEREASLAIALGLEQAFLDDFAPIFDRVIAWEREPDAPLPRVRFRSPVDLAARAIRELFELRGPAVVNASACAAGALAVAHGASLVERGAASIVVCGAADSMVNPLGIGGMSRLGAPSPRFAPDACRPFDRDRDGLAIGEGAAMFVVEDEARALARGARPLARILGWGSTQDAYRVTAPRPDGSAAGEAMHRALARADLAPDAVGYINAHGTGTPLNDPAECRAIRLALGAHADRVAVSSIKGAVGHLMAASGAIEIAACLLAFERDLLPGTAHLANRDPACDLDIVGPEPRRASVDVVMSNSFGFGGQNASVVLGRAP